jgi:4-carboxymuconolactone decarboxylase
MKAATDYGLGIYEQLRGSDRAEQMKETIQSRRFGSAMTGLAMDFVFGQVWADEALDRRARSLVTLGILIALRQFEELKNHVRIALTNGLTPTEIEQVMIQASAYAGFPAAHSASRAAAEVLDAIENENLNENP